MTTAGRIAASYGAAFGAWLVGLVAIVFVQTALVWTADAPTWPHAEIAWHLVTAAAALAPFVAFAGGGWVERHEPMRRAGLVELAVATTIVAAAYYVSTSFVVPRLMYDRDAARGADVEQLYPFGPADLASLLQRRNHLVTNPPSRYSYSTERPLERPPNWLDFVIHRDAAWAVFAMLNSFLGLLAARALARDGPRHRRRKLWAAGLASGVVFLAVARLGEGIVRSSLTVSGVAMAWLPLVVPLAAIGWLSLGPARPALVHARPVAGEKAGV